MNKRISSVLDVLTGSIEDKNMKLVELILKDLNFSDEYGMGWLHLLVDEQADEIVTFEAIKILLQLGLDPNKKDNCGYNFIQVAMYTGYSEGFIYSCIEYALKYKLNVNHVDQDKDTMMHTAIESDDYYGKLDKIYNLLCKHGFKSNALNNNGDSIIDSMKKSTKYSYFYKEQFINSITNKKKKKSR